MGAYEIIAYNCGDPTFCTWRANLHTKITKNIFIPILFYNKHIIK